MIVKIGNTDISDYLALNGLTYTRNDIDGPNAGRALDGTMYRDRVAIKAKYEINCRPLTTAEKNTLFNLI